MSNTENSDPLANIMGPAFADVGDSDNVLLKANEMIAKARADALENLPELENSFRLMILVDTLDRQLLQSSIKQIAKYALDYVNEVGVGGKGLHG